MCILCTGYFLIPIMQTPKELKKNMKTQINFYVDNHLIKSLLINNINISEIFENKNGSMNVVLIENGNSIEYTGITRIAFV